MSAVRSVQWCLALPLVLALLLATGCSSRPATNAPATHPVTGKLLDKAGQPVTTGMLEFSMLQNDVPKTATAELQSDGTFSLTTMNAEGAKFTGAEPGEYRVTYYPLMSAAQTEVPIILPKSQRVEAQPNELHLQLE